LTYRNFLQRRIWPWLVFGVAFGVAFVTAAAFTGQGKGGNRGNRGIIGDASSRGLAHGCSRYN
jgi:hypothetical protein